MLRESSYVERWSGVRLWVYRTRFGTASTSITLRRADGRVYADNLLARGELPLPAGGVASRSSGAALVGALVALLGAAQVHDLVDQLEAERLAASPGGGPQGGSDRDLTRPLP
jgi:hypothetical protein